MRYCSEGVCMVASEARRSRSRRILRFWLFWRVLGVLQIRIIFVCPFRPSKISFTHYGCSSKKRWNQNKPFNTSHRFLVFRKYTITGVMTKLSRSTHSLIKSLQGLQHPDTHKSALKLDPTEIQGISIIVSKISSKCCRIYGWNE